MILKIASSIFASRISSYTGTEIRQEPQLSLVWRRQDWKPWGMCCVSGLRDGEKCFPPPCFFHPPAAKTEGISPGRTPVQSRQAPSISEVLPDGNLLMQSFTFMPQLHVTLRSNSLVIFWDETWNKTSSHPRIGVKQQGGGAGRDTQNSNSHIGSPFSLH